MNTAMIIISAVVVAAVGIVVGFGLGLFGEKFKVEIDEREAAIRAELPGNNCGGCGFPGCDGLAKAINEGKAPCNKCPVGGAPVGEKISAIMGVSFEAAEKTVAFVKCKGDCDVAVSKDKYYGIRDCSRATTVPGAGEKACSFGCMGFGSCVKACDSDAISIINGVAVVDKDKCVACGKCVKVCPNKLIEIIPYDAVYKVQCVSQDKGPDVKKKCSAGCIGCTLCIKQCESEAIQMNGKVAQIDYEKCTSCGACAEKCPVKVITMV